jgi:hypothetical protein
MKKGSIVAYAADPAKLGEVLEAFIFDETGELGFYVQPFDNSDKFYIDASKVWLLADNL